MTVAREAGIIILPLILIASERNSGCLFARMRRLFSPYVGGVRCDIEPIDPPSHWRHSLGLVHRLHYCELPYTQVHSRYHSSQLGTTRQ